MRVAAVTKEQEDAYFGSGLHRFEIPVAGITWNVNYSGGENGHVWSYFDGGMARLDVWPARKKSREQDEARVLYKGAGFGPFADTTQIPDAGLRGLAEAMLTARYEADRLISEAKAAKVAAKEAARQAALDHIAKAL